MNSIPISPGLHALLNAAASDSAHPGSSPLPAPSIGGGLGTHSSPPLTSISTSSQFLSALHLRSPPSAASSPSSASTLTGMSILRMPPAVTVQSPSPTAAASPSVFSSPSPSSHHPDSPGQDADADGSLPSSSSPARDAPDSPLSSLASASSTLSSTPSAQLQSAFFTSPTTAPTSSSSLSLHTPHANHSPLTSLLQPHSSTLQVRRNSTGGSGITKLLSTFKRTSKASTTLTSSSTASPSIFKKKLTAASALTASSSAASSDSAGGSSCHQCKSRRNYGDLSYCSSSLNKKNKNAVCRKKYCDHCLKKFYRESPIAANGQVWKCPSCRKICCCAACRRREMRGGGGGAAGQHGMNGHGTLGDVANGEMEGQSTGTNTPPSNALSPFHSSIKQENHHQQQQQQNQEQQQQDVEMSPMDQSPSPPQSAFRGLLLSPRTPSLPPLPASALASREKEREARDGKDESLPIRDIHRTLLTVANSPALTALSAAASTLNGSSYNIKKEKSSGLLDGGSMGGGAGPGRYAGLMTASLSRGLGMGGVSGVSGVSALNGHSLLNGHSGSGIRNGSSRRRGGFTDMNGHESSTSSPSSTDDSDGDDDTVLGGGESSTVGEKEDGDEVRNGHTGSAAESALGAFALFYSIGQMGAVQEGVRDVMKRSEVSNAQKLKEIEGIFYQVAEKVSTEEVPLQL